MSNAHAIKVVVRCRPLSEAESKGRHPTVVTCNSKERQVTVHSEIRGQDCKKTYTFDSVFGEFSQQESVFEDISGIVDEVLEGFNCTVFAYGQTGTGKTYTMQGPVMNGDRNVECGIIPRSIHAIFDRLQTKDVNECVVHVSCLEIYNEEILDLLSDSNENDLRIFDDVVKGVFVSNLEEVLVVDPADIFNVLTRCWDRRKTAETKMNAASSRSHTIFTVKVHTKETTVDGESIIKIGKLNLVDLAGSECVGKSEAVGQRAKEAGNINRSLLTLGRVINSLVQGQRHIPYRESKLTRLLQESLGGKAKTILIATVSPSQRALEETLKTLEYAHTAKNILNRPEVNQKVTQKAFVRDLQMNMSMIKKQLEAQRSKSGVFLPPEQFEQMEKDLADSKSQLERQGEQMESLRQELQQISESNQRLRDEMMQMKDSHAKEVNALQEEMERQHSLWQSKCDQLSQTLIIRTQERDEAKEAVIRRDKYMADRSQEIVGCQTSCGAHIIDVRKSLDEYLALHSNRTKIAVDNARCWASTVSQSAKSLQDNMVRISSALQNDLAILFTFLTSISKEDGLPQNLERIRSKLDDLRQKTSSFQVAIKSSCEGQQANFAASLKSFQVEVENALEAGIGNSQMMLTTMREKTVALEEQWALLDAAIKSQQDQHEKQCSGFLESVLESFVDQDLSIQKKCDKLVELIRVEFAELKNENTSRATSINSQFKSLSSEFTDSSNDVRVKVGEVVTIDASIRRSEQDLLSHNIAQAQAARSCLVESLNSIPTSCQQIADVAEDFTTYLNPVHEEIRTSSATMSSPIQTIFESTQTHQQSTESHVNTLRQGVSQYCTETSQICKDQVSVAIDAQQQFESELRYREVHHQALGEISNRMENLVKHSPYSSPKKSERSSKPDSRTGSPTKPCISRLKRPRPLSREFDGVENERPMNV